jgi:hypothetical protein
VLKKPPFNKPLANRLLTKPLQVGVGSLFFSMGQLSLLTQTQIWVKNNMTFLHLAYTQTKISQSFSPIELLLKLMFFLNMQT